MCARRFVLELFENRVHLPVLSIDVLQVILLRLLPVAVLGDVVHL